MPESIAMPASIARLPVDPIRKFPVPWFVRWFEGKPEFRVADADKLVLAVKERRCWVCGDRLDNRCTYVIGPMCVVNRTTSEPPCHPDCARYSAMACPFLSRPMMERREAGLPEGGDCAGYMIKRNPGVTCLWTGKSPGAVRFDDGRGGVLFRLNPPLSLWWFREGRIATPAEVWEAVDSGLPLLAEQARLQPGALTVLAKLLFEASLLFPPRPEGVMS